MAAARIVFIAGSSGDDDPEAKARIPTQDISMMQRTKHFMVGKFLFGFREGTTTSAKGNGRKYLPRLRRPYYRAFASSSYAYRNDRRRGKVCGRLILPLGISSFGRIL
jgi:hypothetical protein